MSTETLLCNAQELLFFIIYSKNLDHQFFGHILLFKIEFKSLIPYWQPSMIWNKWISSYTPDELWGKSIRNQEKETYA